MAGSTPSEMTSQRRSRFGCRECRRRHRRCDEAKPSCSYCSSVSITCEYSRELSWGGRPFQKSRFGQCLGRDIGVIKVASEESEPRTAKRRKLKSNSDSSSTERNSLRSQFVYTTTGNTATHCALVDQEASNACNEENIATETTDGPIIQGSQPDDPEEGQLSWEPSSFQTLECSPELYLLSPRFRNLLGYFQYGMSRSFSCHEGIQNNICSALIPMAMSSPHLMAAMLCAAASHRLSVGLEHPDDVIRLRSIAIQRLNVALASSAQHDSMAALGTSLVLCMSEIVSPEATGGDWRVHLSGASALLERFDGQVQSAESPMKFLKRFYASLKVISAGCGICDGRELYNDESMTSNDYIDDLAGFSTALVPIFESISNMDNADASTSPAYDSSIAMVSVNPIPQGLRLIERVRTMLMVRRINLRPKLSSVSVATKTDFGLLDEAYHHMALLQLYERVDSEDEQFNGAIQQSVERIISCIGAMDIAARPCPGVATLPPLFAAGCCAMRGNDRARIVALLLHIRACFGMGNVTCTHRFLKKRWASSKVRSIPKGSQMDDLGFLPY